MTSERTKQIMLQKITDVAPETLDRFCFLMYDIQDQADHPHKIMSEDYENHPYWTRLEDSLEVKVKVDDVMVYVYLYLK